MATIQKIVPCLWFDGQAEAAVDHYVSIFKHSSITHVDRYKDDAPNPDGAVLFIDASRAIVLRTAEPRWLRLTPRDADVALEAGYCAGNHHWKVRFEPGALLIATQGPALALPSSSLFLQAKRP